MAHSVELVVSAPVALRDRLTTFGRLLLAVPHVALVGLPVALFLSASGLWSPSGPTKSTVTLVAPPITWSHTRETTTTRTQESSEGRTSMSHSSTSTVSWKAGATAEEGAQLGALGVGLAGLGLLDWFAVLLFGVVARGVQPWKLRILAWRARVMAYCLLLTDAYPPFGDAEDHPARLTVALPPPGERRSRLRTLLRPLLLLPHAIVLALLTVVAALAGLAGWLSVLVTGRLPAPLWEFLAGYAQWVLRAEAYAFLLVDEYPPFSLRVRPAA
jgi:hypothetical protein